MRKIKFRAWIVDEEKYYYNVQNTYDYIDWFNTGDEPAPYMCFGDMLNDENIILEQYTGLKDKNGVEIYEGDIVLFDKNHENNHQEKILIDFISGKKTPCFEIVYSNNLTAFRKSLIFPPEERANHKYETTIHNGDIVVGNIHENGELLK